MPAPWIPSIGLGLALNLVAPAPEPAVPEVPAGPEESGAGRPSDAPVEVERPAGEGPVERPAEVGEPSPQEPGPPELADPAIEWPEPTEPEAAEPAVDPAEGDLSPETDPDDESGDDEFGDDEFGDDADDEPWPEDFADDDGDTAPLPDYDPLRDSPQAIAARHWVRTGVITLSAGGALVLGAVLFAVSDPNNLALGNSGQVDARNRAALTLGIPGALLVGTGITTLTIGHRRRQALAVDLQASRRGVGLGLRGRF